MARPKSDPDEVRDRILETAEALFRRIGFQKTAVADIADELGMSSANVYRYFPSKSAINDCICARVLDEAVEVATGVARGEGSAADRLEAMLIDLHRHTKSTMLHEKRMHDMVAMALQENWKTIEGYTARLVAILEDLIREGVAAGEFTVENPRVAAECVKASYGMLLHPAMIEQCIDDDLDTRSAVLARFLVRSLRAVPVA